MAWINGEAIGALCLRSFALPIILQSFVAWSHGCVWYTHVGVGLDKLPAFGREVSFLFICIKKHGFLSLSSVEASVVKKIYLSE